jgi:H+/gluconate symporter-like permease
MTTQQVLAQVQIQSTVSCYEAVGLLETLIQEYKEQPNWLGESNTGKSKFVLHINHDSGEWTLLQIVGKMGCVLANGRGSIVLPKFEESKPRT